MKHAKKAFLASVLSVVLCVTMLVGTTYAWFTDSVTSAGNIIKAGILDIDFAWADGTKKPEEATFKDASQGPMFTYELWEPGYADVKHIAIKNVGTLALKYQIRIVANGTVSELADAIDVYYVDPATQITSRDMLTDAYKIGTLTQVLAGINGATNSASGVLVPVGKEGNGFKSAEYLTIALKMRESAGNEYQGLSLGASFSVQLLATQYTFEEDSFGPDYDNLADGTPDNDPWPVTATASASDSQEVQASTATTFNVPVTPSQTVNNTEVTFAAGNLEEGVNYKLNVTTTNLENSIENVTYTVSDGTSAVAGIDLELLKNNVVETVSDKNITIVTYIAKGISNPVVKYSGDTTEVIPFTYDPATGRLEFTVTHFSEYYVVSDSVAYIYRNDTVYSTLEATFADMVSGDEILLLNNVTADSEKEIILGKNVSINLAGKTMKNYPLVSSSALSLSGNGTVETDNYAAVRMQDGGTLTLAGVALKANSADGLSIQNGIYGGDDEGSACTVNVVVAAETENTITAVHSRADGIWTLAWAANLTLNITGTGKLAVNGGNAGIHMYGGGGNVFADFTGLSELNLFGSESVDEGYHNTLLLAVEAGAFSTDVTDYCADGYLTAYDETSDTYVLGPVGADNAPVSLKNGDTTKYVASLAQAMLLAEDNAVITLLKDITVSDVFNTMNATHLTIDLNGHTVSNVEGYSDWSFHKNWAENYNVTDPMYITIKNGTYYAKNDLRFNENIHATIQNVVFENAGTSFNNELVHVYSDLNVNTYPTAGAAENEVLFENCTFKNCGAALKGVNGAQSINATFKGCSFQNSLSSNSSYGLISTNYYVHGNIIVEDTSLTSTVGSVSGVYIGSTSGSNGNNPVGLTLKNVEIHVPSGATPVYKGMATVTEEGTNRYYKGETAVAYNGTALE